MFVRKKWLGLIVSVVILLVVCTMILGNPSAQTVDSDIEKSISYKVTKDGAILWGFKSLPKETIDSAISYIKDNGYDGKEIIFTFQNSPYTYSIYFPKKSGSNVYYATQIYKNAFIGYIGISDTGEIYDVVNLMTMEELSEIVFEPDVGSQAAIVSARAFLDASPQVPADIVSRRIYKDNDSVYLCYMIKLEDYDQYVFVNGITGEAIEAIDIIDITNVF